MQQHYIGRVLRVQDGIFFVSPITGLTIGEVVHVYTKKNEILYGLVFDIDIVMSRLVLLTGDLTALEVGQRVMRTQASPVTRAGRGVLGHIVGTFGEFFPTDDIDNMDVMEYFLLKNCYSLFIPIVQRSPTILERMPVRCPLYTGTIAVDCFFPIGRGQRQLFIGDNKSGKTTLALTTLINQRRVNAEALTLMPSLFERMEVGLHVSSLLFTPCIYVALGQRRAEVVRIYRFLEEKNALYYTCIVFAGTEMGGCEPYLAPYAGSAIGEWFRSYGYHALIIYDDLTAHAIAYRQLSLLLRRPPSREAFPADIFFLHARLLERAAQLNFVLGAGSLTAIPIIETQLEDIAAYIPTNVISITDGQIFLSRKLANGGQQPAVDFGLSVSRIGTSAQTPIYAEMSKRIRQIYASYRRVKATEKMGGQSTAETKASIKRGKRIHMLVGQPQYHTYTVIQQLFGVYFLAGKLLEDVPEQYTRLFLSFILNEELMRTYIPYTVRNLFEGPALADVTLMSHTFSVDYLFAGVGERIRSVVKYMLEVFEVNEKVQDVFLAFASL